jgi:hypothetical protein
MLLSNKKNYVIVSLIVLCCIFVGYEGRGQTTIYSENFDAMSNIVPLTTSSSPWKVTNITASSSNWSVYPACTPPSGTKCLEMYAGSYDCDYYYSDDCNKIAWCGTAINASDYENLKLNFKWKAGGQNNYDYLMAVYSTDGSTWYDVSATKYWNQSSWQTVANLDLSACDGDSFYIGFRWINDSNTGSLPGPCVDDISITGTISSSPSLSVSALTSFGNVCTNTTAGPNSFTITGTNLSTADIIVGSLSGYTFATTSGGTYSSSLSLTQPGSSYSQTIYVKFSPTAVQSYNGNIVVGGGGASSVICAANGSGINTAPTISTPTSASVTATTAVLGGNITSIGCTNVTTRGIYYSTTNGFANGTGTQVSETGTYGTGTFTVNVSGLAPNTVYYYKAFATNSGGTVYSSQGSFTTLCSTPSTQANNITFSSVTSNSMTVNWSRGASPGDGVIVLIHSGSAVDANPVNGSTYTADASIPFTGSQIGTGNYVVYLASGTSVSITGLSPNTTYYYKVYEKNCSGAGSVFNTTSPAEGNQTTLCADPSTSPSGVNFSSVTSNSMIVNWTRGGTPGDGVIVVAKVGSAPTDPSDGVTYTANAAFGSGTEIGTGSFVVYMDQEPVLMLQISAIIQLIISKFSKRTAVVQDLWLEPQALPVGIELLIVYHMVFHTPKDLKADMSGQQILELQITILV